MRFPSITSIAFACLMATLAASGPSHAQSGGSSGGGSSGGGSSGGASSGGAGSTSGGASGSPSYSASPAAGAASSSGTAAARGGGGHGAAADLPPEPETAGRSVRCPDGTIGKTNAGGCLGDPPRR